MPNGSLAPWTTSTGTLTRHRARPDGSAHPAGPAGAAGRPGTARPPASVSAAVRQATRAPEERPPDTIGSRFSGLGPQMREHRDPGGVELARGRRRAPAGDPVGLLDERDAEPLGLRHLGGRHQVARADATAGAVAEHDRADGAADLGHVRPGRAVRGVDLDHTHGSGRILPNPHKCTLDPGRSATAAKYALYRTFATLEPRGVPSVQLFAQDRGHNRGHDRPQPRRANCMRPPRRSSPPARASSPPTRATRRSRSASTRSTSNRPKSSAARTARSCSRPPAPRSSSAA